MRLSVLDQSPVREGGSPAEAVRESVALARVADAAGYHRYWLAEHHDSSGLASTAPEVLIPQVAAETSRIRVGSGGVMLPHYSPLKVAEVFRTLEALHPGRIDLGVGRATGSGARVARALASGPEGRPLDEYPKQVDDLVGYLTDALPEDHQFFGVHAQPSGPEAPPLWLLGSSMESAQIAADQGLPYCYAHFINPEAGTRAIALYREQYQPSARHRQPQVAAAVSALCAPTTEDALLRSWSRYCMRFRHRGVPSIETALAFEYTPAELEYVAFSRERAPIGNPATVRTRLEALAQELTVDELLLLTITYDFKHRAESYQLIAEEFGLTETAAATGAARAK